MTRWGYDEPRGVIVGKCVIQWELYYESRSQSSRHYAETEEQAITEANALAHKLRSENVAIGLFANDAFEVRLFD